MYVYNTHAWFRIDRNHRNILFVVVFIHFELRFYVLERYFRTHFEILDHFVSKSNLTYSVNYYDIFSDLTLSVYFTEYYWILKFTEFTEYLVVSTEYLNLACHLWHARVYHKLTTRLAVLAVVMSLVTGTATVF